MCNGGQNRQEDHLEWFRSTGEPQSGYIDGNNFLDKEVEFSDINGRAIFEGDIVLGSIDEIRKSPADASEDGPPASGIAHGIGITGTRFRWPNGVIPWEFDNNFPQERRQTVRDAISHWEQNTFLRFPQRTNQNDRVRFISDDGCWSYVGRRGNRQDLSLAGGCGFGAAVHEIGHAVGLWHEQSREDRARFVRILWGNIQPGREHNFNQHINDGDDIGNYDYLSIMHYGRFAFSRNRQPTIEPVQQGAQIGQRNGLSPGDIAAVRALYPDVGPIKPGTISTPQELRLRDGNGRDLIMVSGYAVFNFQGRGSSWIRRDIHIPVGPRWMRLDDVSATVSLASVSNRHHAVNAGFATDNCRWTRHNGRALLQSRLAVRDSDGYIHRVAYNATLSGRLR